MAKTDFLSLLDFGRDELDEILELSGRLKGAWREGQRDEPLRGKTLGVIFHKPSLRTRLSFEVGMRQLGGESLYITDQEIGFGQREAVKDIGAVMSRFLDGIMIRTFAHANVESLAAAASIPVINGLTDWVHPCQILSDLLTIQERALAPDGLRIAYVGDGNNVANSWIHATQVYELDLRLACPQGFEPSSKSIERVRRKGRGTVRILTDPREAVDGAQVVYTDTWTSMGQEGEAVARRNAFSSYQVNDELLKAAHPEAIVMHCLPAHRGDEITDGVIDGPQSVVYDQAENRMHCQKGILLHCLGESR
ncbi:MAG: ornithine carbamoyltransferase [Candidatus Eisenbacteria sp.]|nr:ornithine carbamoyltransferase [Candidatus Eisenbacteria bacterium]